MSGVSTHVLDLASGKPAVGVQIILSRLENGQAHRLADVVTNSDGRVDKPLVEGKDFVAGVYELVFHVGDYFRAGLGSKPPFGFLDVVPLRFGVCDPTQHYHVPLLVTPWSFSTYRGS